MLAFLLVAAQLQSAVPAPCGAEARLFALANGERERAGVAPLQWHEPLAEIARAHAADMRERGEISHSSADGSVLADRVTRREIRVERAAENTGRAAGVEQVHAELMQSPGHRANILDARLQVAGFGVVEGGDGTWIVQDFGKLAPAWTEAEARAAVLDAVRACGWATREDPALSRALEPSARAMAAADSASVKDLANPGCWMLGLAGPDPSELPADRGPGCHATRAGIALQWARSPTRPLGAWFVVIVVAP